MAEISAMGIAEASIILLISVCIVLGNTLIVCCLLIKSNRPKHSFLYYILSLATNDLLVGILIVPVSIYPAILQKRFYGDMVCRLEGYFGVTMWSICVYTFMWMSVDRYLCVKKPQRYDSIQTKTRCKCWMIVTWVTSIFMCSPPLLGFTEARYYRNGFLCLPDFSNMVAYSTTFGILVLGPSTITILYSYTYIFKVMYKYSRIQSKGSKDLANAGFMNETLSDPNNLMAFILIVVFLFCWTPWTCLRAYEQIVKRDVESPILQFTVSWIGITNSVWKVVIYLAMSRKIRRRAILLLTRVACFARCSSTSTIISSV